MKQRIDGRINFSGLGKPMNMVKKGQQVYFQEKQKNDMSDFSTKKINAYSDIVTELKGAGTTSAKLKLLKNYANLYNMSSDDVFKLAKAANLPQFSGSQMKNFSKNACEVLFNKYLDQLDELTELTTSNWVDWKAKEFNKIVKNGIGNLGSLSLKINVAEFSTATGEFDMVPSTISGNEKEAEAVRFLVTLDKELNDCLEKYLESLGASQLGEFTVADGRRRSKSRRRSRKSPIHDGRKRSKKPTSKKMSLKKRSKKMSKKRSLKKPKFDGSNKLREWIAKLKSKKH